MRFIGCDPLSGRAIAVETDGRMITTVEDLPRSSAGQAYLSPGFFDIQVNGYAGVDYAGDTFEASDVERVVRALAPSGTTRHLATIITSPRERIIKNCGEIARSVRDSELVRACVPGIHIEGPFISAEDGPRGAHDGRFVRPADFDEFLRWQDAAEGLVKLVTVAPEAEGALSFIERIGGVGVTVGIGHTGADPALIRDAVAAGARLSTHLGNGCHRLLHRHHNHVWEQLASDELSASIIADGFHLPDAPLAVFARAKGTDRLILVSDVMPLAGSAAGRYRWAGTEVKLHEDGHVTVAESELLAGAGHLLDRDIARFCAATGASLGEAVRLCTTNPMRLLGFPADWSTLTPGAPAHLVVFRHEAGREALLVEVCVAAGEELYRRGT